MIFSKPLRQHCEGMPAARNCMGKKKGGLGEMQHLSESLKTQIKIVLMLLWFRGDWKEQF